MNIKIYNIFLSILILSLFIHIRYETPLLIIRPFDLLCLLFFPLAIAIKKDIVEQRNLGFYYLIPFLMIHAFSALALGTNNFLRELLQILIIIIFALIVSNFKTKINFRDTFFYLLIGALLIMLSTIVWHYSRGYFVGWKQLPDTRIIFTIVTILTFLYLAFFKEDKKNQFLILLFLLLPILIMSGERKALIIFFLLFLIQFSPGFTIKTFILLCGIYLFLNLISMFIENPYIHNKIDNILNVMHTGNVNYFLSTGTIDEKDSFSNLQRAFSFQVSKDLFIENPILGIGTNNYVNHVSDKFFYLPKFMKIGIHGEFQRVLIENGLIGLIAYVFIWYKSWTRSKEILFQAERDKIIDKNHINFCLYSIYLSFAFYVGTEASSTRSFLMLVIISLLPDYINYQLNLKRNGELKK